jgi:hypothetical protein
MMLRPPSILPVWWLALNEFQSIEFSDDDLTRYVKQVIRGVDGWGEVAPSSVKKDVDCFLRTYSPVSGRESRDDNIDCPFRVIGLISPVPGERRMYRFLVGPKVTLPDEILAFACLDFVGESTRMRTATLTRLAVDPGSPGRVFRLNEDSITESLQRLEMAGSLIKVSTVAGITQISWEGQPADLAWGILSDYFQRASGSSRVMTSVARERVHGDTQPNPNGDVHLDMPNVQIPDTSDVMARLKLIRRKQEIPLGAAK